MVAAWPNQAPDLAIMSSASTSASAADTETILQALIDRLRVEYLRHYGSAG